ncbi:integrase [Halostagnicola larsenii XH-48]|uniref:Integrase n=1 Tax=Halostagnicola larsenii XH-48 TaxID=797299 RepID=W0JN91_9EURY|nr:tyrosine-type recombinase/integrase [Halostagnicola larsenii]AHF98447.1 integrase [Halostagnicola larsenii XH-48]
MTTELEPLGPETARQMYLDERRHELADATLQSHDYRLKQFVQWCENEEIDNLNDFSARDIHRFRVKRRNEDELATASMKGQLATLRVFLRFCVSIDAVQAGLDEKIILPTTTADDARDELLSRDRAQKILDHLERYRYARLEHALLEVLWHTGFRIGAATGIDVEDYRSDDQYLALVHRPDEGTSLKNGSKSERLVALNDRVCLVLDDWLEVNHPEVVDDHGRTPLFATKRSRLSRNRGRTIAYQYTRPCIYENKCPHDRDIAECEARPTEYAHKCPSALSPHPVRRGSITHHLQSDTPERIVSDRMDVGMDVLERHYDQRSAREKLEQRRQYLPDG